MTNQSTDIGGFADFMQKLSTVKEHVPSLKEKVEYIKNLYEVSIDMNVPLECTCKYEVVNMSLLHAHGTA